MWIPPAFGKAGSGAGTPAGICYLPTVAELLGFQCLNCLEILVPWLGFEGGCVNPLSFKQESVCQKVTCDLPLMGREGRKRSLVIHPLPWHQGRIGMLCVSFPKLDTWRALSRGMPICWGVILCLGIFVLRDVAVITGETIPGLPTWVDCLQGPCCCRQHFVPFLHIVVLTGTAV